MSFGDGSGRGIRAEQGERLAGVADQKTPFLTPKKDQGATAAARRGGHRLEGGRDWWELGRGTGLVGSGVRWQLGMGWEWGWECGIGEGGSGWDLWDVRGDRGGIGGKRSEVAARD